MNEIDKLLALMDEQSAHRLPEDSFTELRQIAAHYNTVVDALEQANARTEAIIRTAMDGIVTFTKDAVLSLNPAAERIFGYAGDELRGKSISVLADVSDQFLTDLLTA